jgi:hypothetical protein
LAAQLSKIQSSTPGYAKGRKGGPAETAIVGEQGFEYISTDTGLFKTPNRATMTYLPAGASVIPHNKSVQIEHYLKSPAIASAKEKENKENLELLNEIKKLNRKPTAVVNMNKHGIRAGIIAGNSFINYVNNNLTMKR